MSRTTLSPAKRGVAGLTAAALTFGTLGVVLVGNSSAAGPVIALTSAKVANPNPATVKAEPTVNALGPTDGTGPAVHIVGDNFPATPTVKFGTVDSPSVVRVSSKLVIAKPPAAASALTADTKVNIIVGEVDSVDDSLESVDQTLTDGYQYKVGPDVTSAGYSADGKALEIVGTSLKDVHTLQLGPLTVKVKPAETTATKVTVKVPSALTKARYDITATTPWGTDTLTSAWSVVPIAKAITSATATAGKFTAVKSADSLNPNTVVRITGTSLSGVTGVAFGNAPATSFVSASDTELFVVVPAVSATATPVNNVVKVDVVVRNGSLKQPKPLTFEYKVAPIVTAIDKTSAATNTVVTVTGSNLAGAKLYFGTGTGAKALSPKSGSSAGSAQYTMPKTAGSGFALNTDYTVWIVSKGGNLNTGRQLRVTG